MNESALDQAPSHITSELVRCRQSFALVGGLGVSIRGEVRFTRDVGIAIAVASDDDVEALVRDLRSAGYGVIAQVEHDTQARLAIVRLRSPTGIVVDLRAASSGMVRDLLSRITMRGYHREQDLPAKLDELLANRR